MLGYLPQDFQIFYSIENLGISSINAGSLAGLKNRKERMAESTGC